MLVEVLPSYLSRLQAYYRYLLYSLPKVIEVITHVGEAARPSGLWGV